MNTTIDRFAIATVDVTIYDINDHHPVMSASSYAESVLESAVPGSVVMTVAASDQDQVGGLWSSFYHIV